MSLKTQLLIVQLQMQLQQMIEEEIVMIKSWKKAAIMCLTSLLLATALPFGAQVKAASSSPLHSKLDADG